MWKSLFCAALALTLPLLLATPAPAQDREGNAVTFEGLIKLLKSNADEADIMRQIDDSPTVPILSGIQIGELKDAGASQKLIKYLQAKANQGAGSAASDITNFALVLDCSGSMLDKVPDGRSKMEAAKEVVIRFIKAVPAGKRLTFLVYGTDPERKCQDVTVMMPLQPLTESNREKLLEWIPKIRGIGFTPLALSIRKVREELEGAEGLSRVVVITDGMDTCKGDPGVEADLLAKLKVPNGVQMVGFRVDPDEQKALEKIIEGHKVTFYSVLKPPELDKVVEDFSKVIVVLPKRGIVATVNPGGRSLKMFLLGTEKALTFRVGEDCPVLLDGKPVGLGDLQPGMGLKVLPKEEGSDTAAKVEAEAGKEEPGEKVAKQTPRAKAAEPPEEPREAEPPATGKFDPLPGEGRIAWHTDILEKNPEHFKCLRRTVKDREVSWVIRIESDTGLKYMSTLRAGAPFRNALSGTDTVITARFTDEDQTQLLKTYLAPNTNDVQRGQNVRLTLRLPGDDVLKKTAKVEFLYEWWGDAVKPLPSKQTPRAKAAEPPEEPREAEPPATGKFDPLPGEGRIAWHTDILEKNPEHFKCLRRTVKDREVSWVIRIESDTGLKYMSTLRAGAPFRNALSGTDTVITARFTDEDQTQLLKTYLAPNTNDVQRGQNMRLTLRLPGDDVLKKTAKVEFLYEWWGDAVKPLPSKKRPR